MENVLQLVLLSAIVCSSCILGYLLAIWIKWIFITKKFTDRYGKWK